MWNKFIRISFLLICAGFTLSPAHAMDVSEHPEASSKSIVPSLQKQVESVAAFIQQRTERNFPVKMALGGCNQDSERELGEEWIILDICQDPKGRLSIQANFNELEQLLCIATGIGPSLNQIVMDDETFKYTKWTKEHLKLFAQMLVPDGEFSFPFVPLEVPPESVPPYLHSSTLLTVTEDEGIEDAVNKLNIYYFKLDTLPVKFCLPEMEPSQDRLQSSRVTAVINFSEAGTDESLLRREIAILQMTSKARNIAKEKCYEPIINSLKTLFRDVGMQKNVPLPFPSDYDRVYRELNKPRCLISGKNPILE